MNEFFAMGGHAAYIWPSYGVAAILLAGLWIASRRALKAREAELDKTEPSDRRRGAR